MRLKLVVVCECVCVCVCVCVSVWWEGGREIHNIKGLGLGYGSRII